MEETVSCQSKRDYIYMLFTAILALFISLQDVCSPVSARINYSDGSIYQYIGHLICIGKMPYVDAFDHKGPILYLINAFSFLFGSHGIWVVDLLFMLTYAFIAYSIARKYADSCWSFVISVSLVVTLSSAYWIGNTPDWYTSVAIMYCVSLFVKYCDKKTLSNTNIFFVGVMLAFCFWQKFTSIVSIGVLSIGIILIDFNMTKSAKFAIKCIGISILGFAAVTIPLLLWLWKNGAVEAMVKDYFLFSTSYGTAQVAMQEKVKAFRFFCADPFILMTLVGLVCFLFSGWTLRAVRSAEHFTGDFSSEDLRSDIVTASLSVISFTIQAMVNAMAGRQYVQYKLVLYPLAFLLLCIFLKFVLNLAKKSRIRWILLIILGICIACNLNGAIGNQKGISNPAGAVEFNEIKQYITSGEDVAVATPDDCGLYLNTGTESATQYPYVQADLYGSNDFWQKYNEQLTQSDPSVIVWNNNWDVNYYLTSDILSKYERVDLGRLAVFKRQL